MQDHTLQKVREFIKDTRMLEGCSEMILGVSGGPDSMSMLHILNSLKDEFHYSLRVVHVNHSIRGAEAERDQQMVEAVCREWNLPCRVYVYDVPKLAVEWKMGTEETGRKVRRKAFEEEKSKSMQLSKTVKIALAHNQNDMAETMLHHLARGTGIRGLCSLKPVNGEIIRPLLCLERCEIVNYVKEHGIRTVQDSSNLEDDYTRNRIRRHILPLLEREVNARTVTHMAEAAEIFDQAEQYFAAQARMITARYGNAQEGYVLTEDFFQKEKIIQTYAIREILETTAGHQSDLTSGHIRQIQNLWEMQTGKRISLPYEMEAVKRYGDIKIRKVSSGSEVEESMVSQRQQELIIPGETVWTGGRFFSRIFSYNGEKILEKKYTKWFDCDKINCGLSVRTRKNGDYMTVNQNGGHKKLTRCMIDDKIPGEIRGEIPLIADGNEILWITGGRINERYKITSETGRVLEITYQGGNVQ